MKHNKTRFTLLTRLLGCLLGAIFLCALTPAGVFAAGTLAAGAFAAETAPPFSEPLRVYGTLHRDGERITVTNIHGDTELDELVLNISDETRILDAVNGFPVAVDSLREGETVYAYISQAMALSLPPQSHATMIICQIPADYAVPLYETAAALTAQNESTYLLTTARGSKYLIDGSSVLLPYLTRNIVTAQDLTEGRTCLIWSDGTSYLTEDGSPVMKAREIVIFAPSHSEQPSGPASDPELTNKIQLK